MVQAIVNATVLCLLAHMVGDYVIQNDWMALQKTHNWAVAAIHGATYTIPFVPVVWGLHASWWALAVIGGTHVVLDHTYAVKYLIWAKNQLAPKAYRFAQTPTGFGPDRPDWIAVWLMIIVDNLTHMLINIASVVWL